MYTSILCMYRSVGTLRNNRNCDIDFSSFEIYNKKQNYAQWALKRKEKNEVSFLFFWMFLFLFIFVLFLDFFFLFCLFLFLFCFI